MNSLTPVGGQVPDELAPVYQLIATELDQVSALLFDKLQHTVPYIDAIVRHSFQLGGKRLRPVLVLLGGKLCGTIVREHILAASALEMIHTGSLIHDDILDGATFRRHLATVHVRWDAQSAVLAGDLLLTQAMQTITECNDITVYREIARACQSTCEGELMQIGARENFEMSREEYFKIIGGKTAALLACCCWLGGYFAKASPKLTNSLHDFGHSLGIAFQMIDDILDLTGNEELTGKTLGTDILNGKPTLPFIIFRERASVSERKTLFSLLTQENRNLSTFFQVRDILIQTGAVEAARKEAAQILETALGTILESGDAICPETYTALANVGHFVLSRDR